MPVIILAIIPVILFLIIIISIFFHVVLFRVNDNPLILCLLLLLPFESLKFIKSTFIVLDLLIFLKFHYFIFLKAFPTFTYLSVFAFEEFSLTNYDNFLPLKAITL